jgi:hypothetical protein
MGRRRRGTNVKIKTACPQHLRCSVLCLSAGLGGSQVFLFFAAAPSVERGVEVGEQGLDVFRRRGGRRLQGFRFHGHGKSGNVRGIVD